MLNRFPTSPRSTYPEQKRRKYNFTSHGNYIAYKNASDEMGIDTSIWGPDRLSQQEIEFLVDLIATTTSVHIATVCSDRLFDAYNSYPEIIETVARRLRGAKKAEREKLVLMLRYLKLDEGRNRRPVEDKHYNEVLADVAYFREMGDRSIKLVEEFGS